ncbi:putative transmembrane protein 2g [SARS coronavirus ZJ0301]|uniref:Putative transmembrane protein 2g n=2 Tax=Severe acute respiratory syndrome coronavirus TaxID=694009 RepID=Q3S2C6_SARS|nr:putative transmembrane protein 2g [SARS coronavirus ZJ01]ABA02266.1 putative transmembrane protein 2g [SARS coronavirus ZJ0301]
MVLSSYMSRMCHPRRGTSPQRQQFVMKAKHTSLVKVFLCLMALLGLLHRGTSFLHK